MTRFCANCGTEVDDTAVFCPTCGQPVDQATETEMPAAPAWPEPTRPSDAQETAPAPPPPVVASTPERAVAPPPMASERAAPPAPAARPGAPPPAAAPPGAGTPIQVTTPLTLSGWLIGGGAALGALGALVGLFDGVLNPLELVLLVALLGIAATVFLETAMPEIPHLRLATLAILLVGLGVALDRLTSGGAGVGELLLFLGIAGASIGAILLQLGRDQPMGAAR